MDEGEQPEETVVRELEEELGFKTKVEKLISAYLYKIPSSKNEFRGVLVLIYLCTLIDKTGEFEKVGEAGKAEFKKFPIKDVKMLNMPEFYKQAIKKCSN